MITPRKVINSSILSISSSASLFEISSVITKNSTRFSRLSGFNSLELQRQPHRVIPRSLVGVAK